MRPAGCTPATWRSWTTPAISTSSGGSRTWSSAAARTSIPREIEEFLYTHPDIVDAQVIGVPDERYGEELVAWIQLRPAPDAMTAESLRAFCTGKIAHYKIPRYVKIVDDFPMTVTGKIRKIEMRATSVTELGLERAAGLRHG